MRGLHLELPIAFALLLGLGGRGGSDASSLPRDDEVVELDPADFTTDIDNRYWPMAPGARWVFRELDEEGTEQRVVITVTDETRIVMGIEARVVHDVVTADGELVEDTFDWYAQDADGNVWYLGEDTRELEDAARSSPRPARGRPESKVLNPGSSCRPIRSSG